VPTDAFCEWDFACFGAVAILTWCKRVDAPACRERPVELFVEVESVKGIPIPNDQGAVVAVGGAAVGAGRRHRLHGVKAARVAGVVEWVV
jgi:hypothetical protein